MWGLELEGLVAVDPSVCLAHCGPQLLYPSNGCTFAEIIECVCV